MSDKTPVSEALLARMMIGPLSKREDLLDATEDVVYEVERLRAALQRLVELGSDDGSEPDDAWKRAWERAAEVLAGHKANQIDHE